MGNVIFIFLFFIYLFNKILNFKLESILKN